MKNSNSFTPSITEWCWIIYAVYSFIALIIFLAIVLPVNLSFTTQAEENYGVRLEFPIVSNCSVEKVFQHSDPIINTRTNARLGDHVWCAYLTRCTPHEMEAIALNRRESFLVWSRLFEEYDTADVDSLPDYCLPVEQRENKTFPIRIDPRIDFDLTKMKNSKSITFWSDFNGTFISK